MQNGRVVLELQAINERMLATRARTSVHILRDLHEWAEWLPRRLAGLEPPALASRLASELKPVLEQLASVTSSGLDDATRNHIRNMDVYVARMLEEVTSGRTQMVQEIRSEIRLLARTMAALAEEAER